MIEYVNKPELKKAQVYSKDKNKVMVFISVFNTIADSKKEIIYLNNNWIKKTNKEGERYYFIDVFGKCYKYFDEAIKFYDDKDDFMKEPSILTFK